MLKRYQMTDSMGLAQLIESCGKNHFCRNCPAKVDGKNCIEELMSAAAERLREQAHLLDQQNLYGGNHAND